MFISSNVTYPEVSADVAEFRLNYRKIAKSTIFTDDIYHDSGFDLIGALATEYGKAFGRAEEQGCITGDGATMPKGILHDSFGAETGATATGGICYNDIVKLYFSVAPEYRQNGSWLMNDATALKLRTLKDSAGSPLLNHAADTLFGKPVYISEFMPNAEGGSKPIAFGDFNYYWFAELGSMAFRSLKEMYAVQGRVGVIGMERIDGILVKRDAIKVLAMEGDAAPAEAEQE
jgi:HK97 family phage major capsid protein